MTEKRFILDSDFVKITSQVAWDTKEEKGLTLINLLKLLNEKDKEIGLLRLELETHKHPLWSTREAERRLSEVTNNLADEIKKNGVLNEEINQLRIENMRLKKKGGEW